MSTLFTISEKPIVIAGPCSVETRQQLFSVTNSLAGESRLSVIRCGVWKPRTRPGGFEGLGEPALQWIRELKDDNPTLHFCCEVARPEHVELSLNYGIDALWLGSRTTVNPFLVGELAQALKGTGIPMLVKNPVTPDIALWLGAIERLRQAGIKEIAAVHRGFSTYNNFGYRNNPLWEIPIELKRLMPDVPLLCDPSHIGGSADLVASLAQMALDLHFDGLMVECHPNPQSALTDAQQQITPQQLSAMLDSLKIRKHGGIAPSELQRLRDHLDIIDTQILKLLSQRMKLSADIGEIKRSHNMPLFQPERWQEVLERQMKTGVEMGLDSQFVKDITEKIHAESIRVQEKSR